MPSSFVTNHVHNKFVVIPAAKILILYGSYFSVVSIQPAQVVLNNRLYNRQVLSLIVSGMLLSPVIPIGIYANHE